MYFQVKSTLNCNRYYTFKHLLNWESMVLWCTFLLSGQKQKTCYYFQCEGYLLFGLVRGGY